MQINGGCARIPDILRVPVNILASGPAAAPAAAVHLAGNIGEDLITVDMGGTSIDVCMIQAGRAAMSRDIQVEDQPIGVSAVDVHSIGAGGGLDRVDRRRRRPARRSSQRRIASGTGLLRLRRHASRPSPTRTSCSATCTRTRSSAAGAACATTCRARPSTAAWRDRSALDGRGGRGHRPGGQREHGRRDPRRLDRARPRSARVHACLRRRRRRPARDRAGA